MPSLAFGEAEYRLVFGDDDVADSGEAGAAAERGAVDPSDQRHRQRIERCEHAGRGHRVADVLGLGESNRLGHPGDVGAGAEHLAGAGQHDNTRTVGTESAGMTTCSAHSVSSPMTCSLKALRTSGRFSVHAFDRPSPVLRAAGLCGMTCRVRSYIRKTPNFAGRNRRVERRRQSEGERLTRLDRVEDAVVPQPRRRSSTASLRVRICSRIGCRMRVVLLRR